MCLRHLGRLRLVYSLDTIENVAEIALREDYRILAQRRLPKIIFDYLEGGADDEIGLKHNHEVFERYRLMPRRLVDVRLK